MKPVPPNKPFAPKGYSHYHAKKPKHFHHNKPKMYRQEPDRVENLESLQGDIIPNAIEYILVDFFSFLIVNSYSLVTFWKMEFLAVTLIFLTLLMIKYYFSISKSANKIN